RKELEDRETDNSRDDTQDHEHEKRSRGIESGDKAHQIQDCTGTELADSKGHGSERADLCGLHDDGDDAENRMRRVVYEGAHGVAAFAQAHQGKNEKNLK